MISILVTISAIAVEWTISAFLNVIFISSAAFNYIQQIFTGSDPRHNSNSSRLQSANNYLEWIRIANEIDQKPDISSWKHDLVSPFYDYKLIHSRLNALRAARIGADTPTLVLLIRSGLLRNFGGIMDPRLYSVSFTGTKRNIEDYLEEVNRSMQLISDMDPAVVPVQHKLDLFTEVSQSFGHTALLLHGGASFGLFHLGVVKALYETNMLPRIISGSSVGAMIAALICVHKEEELPVILCNKTLFLPGGINLAAFTTKSASGSLRRKITRLLTKGYLLDVKVLEDCVRTNLGDITFEEAYHISGRVLNITVTSSRKNELPQVFNHLTTPNLLIRSAACVSASMLGLYGSVDLLAKNSDGQIFVWSPASVKAGYFTNEPPEQRLAELFNVNHFILSQSQPFIAPFFAAGQTGEQKSTIVTKVTNFIASEILFRISQLSRIGLLPAGFGSSVEFKVSGHVTICPPVSSMDFYTLFGNPTSSSLGYWMRKGELATWPFLPLIKNRTMIEDKLFKLRTSIRTLMNMRRNLSTEKLISMKKRTLSVS